MISNKKLIQILNKINSDKGLSDSQIENSVKNMLEKLEKYMEEILIWNEKINLTAITQREEFIEKHYVDSLIAHSEEFIVAESIIDVGTGGGFPGIPLAIVYPEKNFLLIDSLNKRLKVIAEIVDKIGIKNVEVLHGRAEDIAKNKLYRENFDICVSRAVANLTSLSELCIPFVKKEGLFIAYKGPSAYTEMEEAKKAINILGGEIVKIAKDDNTGDNHVLIYIKKNKETPKKYPRKAGEPIRNPLK